MSKWSLLFIFVITQYLFAIDKEEYSITGVVLDKNTQSPIAGATIKVIGENKGTYSSTRGKFKIPFLKGDKKLKIISLGYETNIVEINSNSDSITVNLNTLPVRLKEANVIGNIEPNEVIKRAIQRKDENQKLLKTFKGLLYSKFVMEMDGSVFASTSGNTISLGSTIGESAPEQYKMFVLESFSRDYKDYEKKISHSEIIQRRQTANMKPDNNVMALGNFFNFYQDEINFVNVKFTTPLSKDALSYYKFEIIDKDLLDDRYIYIIKVIPDTKLFPCFKGIIKIVEGTYNLVEIDLEPSDETAIAMIEDVHIIQKFEEIQKDIWHPSMLEVNAKAKVEVLKGFMDIKLDAKASSIYSEIEVNTALPDSIYKKEIKRISVAPLADSSDLEYWEKNSLRDITQKEKEMYIKVDSLVAIADSNKKEFSSFNYNLFTPYLDFNRVSSMSIGLSPTLRYKSLKLETTGAFSFGLQDLIGEATLSYTLPIIKNHYITLKTGLFSKVTEIGNDDSYHRIINTAIAALFHFDYYDYNRTDGWFAGFSYTPQYFNIRSNFENSRQFSLHKTTNRSIFQDKEWRLNPSILEGNYNTIKSGLTIYFNRMFRLYDGFSLNLDLNYLFGQELNSKTDFHQYSVSLEYNTPTFKTGYNPMFLSLSFEYNGAKNAPLQYQLNAKTTMLFITKSVNFCTIPVSIYEKEEYYATHIKYNFTDLWWRAIGLPLYYGRGLDLIGRFSTGQFKTAFNANDYYTEAGFGLERIPTFVSNVIFLGAGAVWGVGPIARGNFNWYLDITLPF